MTMPAGEYYVGDICYVLGDEWDEVGRITKWNADGEFELNDRYGTLCSWHGTEYGDGFYYDEKGREYAVDSGTIGCVLLVNPKIRVEAQKIQSQKLGHIIRFGSSFRTHEAGGHIFIGNIEIDTKEDTDWNPNYEDPEDDYEPDEDEDDGLDEGADYGRSKFTNVEDAETISEVYDYVKNSLKNLGTVYGSTTGDSHGYIAISTAGVSVEESMVDKFREMFPNIEFKIREKERNCVSFRTVGSKGWW